MGRIVLRKFTEYYNKYKQITPGTDLNCVFLILGFVFVICFVFVLNMFLVLFSLGRFPKQTCEITSFRGSNCHHRIRRQILPKNAGLTFLLAQN